MVTLCIFLYMIMVGAVFLFMADIEPEKCRANYSINIRLVCCCLTGLFWPITLLTLILIILYSFLD
jgi:hypothetical protein